MIILLQIYKTFPIFIEIDKEMWLFYIKKDAIVNNSPYIFIESLMSDGLSDGICRLTIRWKFFGVELVGHLPESHVADPICCRDEFCK